MSDKPQPKPDLAALKLRLKEVEEELEKSTWSDTRWTKESKKLLDTLDTEWPVAMGWLKKVQKEGAKNLFVTSPLGRIRHLWGYLHPSSFEQGAMNRRGPNSIVQGFASDLGAFSGYLLYRYAWRVFRSKQLPLYMKQIMSIHDSLNIEQPLIETAMSVYVVDHSMTSMLKHFLKKEFDVDTPVGYDNDFKVGISLDDLKEWNLRSEHMLELLKHYGQAIKASTKEIDRCLHDSEIISKIRLRELKEGPDQTPFITADSLEEELGQTFLYRRLVKYKGDKAGYAAACNVKLSA